MKTPSSRITRLTRAVLPAAPLTLVALPAAKAQIIYTDPTPITIDSTGSVVLYIGTGASTDTDFFVGPGNPRRTPGYTMYLAFWNQGVQGSNAPYVWTPTYQPTFKRVVADAILPDGNAEAALLTAGQLISGRMGGGLSFSATSDYTFLNRSDLMSSNWTPGTTGYLGLELNNGANFGWLQVSYNANKTLTIYDFAYQSDGGAIIAGDTGASVPEPATTVAAAGLLAGTVALFLKRRRAKATA